MENTAAIRSLLEPVLKERDIEIYEVLWLTGGDNTLQISITRTDGSMDLDTCAEVSEIISDILDAKDVIKSAYTLEVCSPGAEREIKNLDELKSKEDAHVYLQLKSPVKKMMEFTGTVVELGDEVMKLEYRDKAVKRIAEIPVTDITFIRYAVKF